METDKVANYVHRLTQSMYFILLHYNIFISLVKLLAKKIDIKIILSLVSILFNT